MKEPSKERGCVHKVNVGHAYRLYADSLARKHGKQYGVYRCPHCGGTHMTTKLQNQDQYPPLLYVTAQQNKKEMEG